MIIMREINPVTSEFISNITYLDTLITQIFLSPIINHTIFKIQGKYGTLIYSKRLNIQPIHMNPPITRYRVINNALHDFKYSF